MIFISLQTVWRNRFEYINVVSITELLTLYNDRNTIFKNPTELLKIQRTEELQIQFLKTFNNYFFAFHENLAELQKFN